MIFFNIPFYGLNWKIIVYCLKLFENNIELVCMQTEVHSIIFNPLGINMLTWLQQIYKPKFK